MRILITGGAGFIGSHIYDTYRAAGHTVAVVDNFSNGHLENLPKDALIYREDITDLEGMRRVFAEFQPEAVNHHAAQISVHASIKDPLHDAVTNIIGSTTILSCILEFCPKARLIYGTSGGAMYGETKHGVGSTEDTAVNPLSPYGLSKYVAEQYKWLYSKLHNIHVIVLRYSNAFGPRQNAEGEAGVCGIFTTRMLAGQPVTIFGDGSGTRDYTYVKDIAQANLLALTYDGEATAFNISTGEPTSTRHAFEVIAAATGYTLEAQHQPARHGEIEHSLMSAEKAKRILKWKPAFTFEEGIKETVAWVKKELKK